MILRPYPEYRDSGLPWLGEIPTHWKVRRNGRLFTQRVETGFPELPVLEVSLRTGVRVRDMNNVARKQVMSDFAKYKRAAQGDIAYNMMRMWQGAVGIAPVDGLISPAYVVAKPRPEIDSRYFAYLFRVGAYMREVNKFSHGIVADRNRLYWEDFKQMPSIFPPREEQEKIVAYLSARDRQIARLIRAKQRLIELLTEQKQAIIHRAVTRGLDPDAKMKQTGLDWLPEVPEGWEVKKLKFATKSIVGGSTPSSGQPEFWDGDVVWVTPEDVSKSDVLRGSARKITAQGVASCSTVLMPAHSIIVTSRAPVGNVSVAAVELCTNQGCKALVPDLEQLDAQFLYFLIRILKPELQSLSKGTTFSEISTFTLANVQIPLPSLVEQTQIVAHIFNELRFVQEAIDRIYREIDLIREYRTRLVSDVVTGRLDVRGTELPKVEDIEDPPGVEEPLPPMLDDLVEESRAAP